MTRVRSHGPERNTSIKISSNARHVVWSVRCAVVRNAPKFVTSDMNASKLVLFMTRTLEIQFDSFVQFDLIPKFLDDYMPMNSYWAFSLY